MSTNGSKTAACCDLDNICGGSSNQVIDNDNNTTIPDSLPNAMEEGRREQPEEQSYTGSFLAGLFNSLTSNNKNRNDKDETVTVEALSDSGDRNIRAMVFMISGCKDDQTSADVSNVSNFSLPNPNGRAGGACTSALLKVLYNHHKAVTNLTFVQVLSKMRQVLRKQGFSQIPQLTSSEPLDINHTFYMVPPDCQGTRRAVLIGINYEGQKGELSGCRSDCLNMKDYIQNVWGFKEENITILMDDGDHKSPTRSNILSAYKAVAAESKSGDAVFCHYSGHGGRVRDDDWGEEKDGYDETLVPLDYSSAGQIRDDDLYQTLVCALPAGVHLVSLMDCCHSGTVLDLPNTYRADGEGGELEDGSSNWHRMCSSKNAAMIACIVLIIVVLAIVLPITLT